jgi:phosphatidate cytidylyltransferase
MLRTRVATALVLLAVLLAVLFWLPVAVGIGCFALVVLLGAWEWAAFAGLAHPAGRLLYVLATAALAAAAWFGSAHGAAWLAWMRGAALWWLAALLWLSLAPHAVNRAAAALAGLAVLVPAWLGLARLLGVAPPGRGAALLLYMLLLVWATDIGGYFVGRRFGRLKLAPAVSPNKTWEGVLGGTALGLVVALAGAGWFHAPRAPFVGLGLAVVGASMIGDLTESMFKRYAHLKDSGSLLPGHGGVLDRIDSITSAVPFFVLGLGWLGLLA